MSRLGNRFERLRQDGRAALVPYITAADPRPEDTAGLRHVLEEALRGFHALTRREGIIPALETSHALAFTERLAPKYACGDGMIVNLSGRGDKDLDTVAAIEGIEL